MRRLLSAASRAPLVPVLAIAALLALSAVATGESADDGSPAPRPLRSGPVAVLATGATASGTAYELRAYQSDRGVCLQLALASATGETCAQETGDANAMGLTATDANGERIAYGRLGERIERVRLTVGGIAGPSAVARRSSLGRIYLTEIGASGEIEASGLDAQGRAVASARASAR